MAVARVQSTVLNKGSASPITGAFGGNVVAGNVLVVFLSGSRGGGGLAWDTPTDSVGTTYTLLGTQLSAPANAVGLKVYQGVAAGSGANTVSATVPGGTNQFQAIGLLEVSGSTGVVDKFDGQGLAAASGTRSSPAVTPSAAGSLIVGYGVDASATNANDFTAGSGFTMRSSYGGTADWPAYLEDQTQGPAASVSADFTAAHADAAIVAIATLQPAGSTDYFGAATLAVSFAATDTGKLTAKASATQTQTFTAVTAGTATGIRSGAASLIAAFTRVTAGTLTAKSRATLTETLTITTRSFDGTLLLDEIRGGYIVGATVGRIETPTIGVIS